MWPTILLMSAKWFLWGLVQKERYGEYMMKNKIKISSSSLKVSFVISYGRVLGGVVYCYTQWRNFEAIINKAKFARMQVKMTHHFHVSKMVSVGAGAEREIDDIYFTRYACYLTAQNGDAVSFCVVKPEQHLLDYERVQARTKLAETEKLLSGVFYERGVDSKGFAIIRSKGDKALFRLDTALLKCKLDAPHSRPLVDFLPTISIKAKDFAAEMTSINVQQKDLLDSHQLKKNILRIIRLFGI